MSSDYETQSSFTMDNSYCRNAWTKEITKRLIELYETFENLYNPKHRLYHNKQAREDALFEVTSGVNKLKAGRPFSMQDIKKKINNLRTQFAREKKEVERIKQSGVEDVYSPSAWWFVPMNFLVPYVSQRRATESKKKKRAKIERQESDLENYDLSGSEEHLEFIDMSINNDELESPKKPSGSKKNEKNEDENAENLQDKYENYGVPADIQAFGQFIMSELAQIKSPRMLLEVKQHITQSIFAAKGKEINLQSKKRKIRTSQYLGDCKKTTSE